MMRLVLLVMMVLLVWPGLAALANDPSAIEPFVGSWRGQTDPSADTLSLDVRRDTDGLHISWHDLSGRDDAEADAIDAVFSPTDRAGVYEYAPKTGSFLTSMFASPATGNPLEGETLLWARIEGPTLAVYSMKIDVKGGFDLDHYSWTRTESGLRLIFSKRTQDSGEKARIEGELVAK